MNGQPAYAPNPAMMPQLHSKSQRRRACDPKPRLQAVRWRRPAASGPRAALIECLPDTDANVRFLSVMAGYLGPDAAADAISPLEPRFGSQARRR